MSKGTYSYIRASGVRRIVKENEKRCGRDFLHALDTFLYEKIISMCKIHNGHRVTLDSTVAKVVLGEIKIAKQ